MKAEYRLEAFKASLDSLDGFKAIMKAFLFFIGGPKSGFATWSKASEKQVLQNYKLADYRHEEGDSCYQICAFSTRSSLSPEILAELSAKAQNFDLGTVRYEASMQSSSPQFRQLDFDDKESAQIISLSQVDAGIFVYPVPTDSTVKDFPVVLYARTNEGAHYFYPIEAAWLKDFRM